jgi:hypothetical protein
MIDIPRATESGRKIRFSYARGNKLYYDTAFGEEFIIHTWHIPPSGIHREENASDFISQMQHYNEEHAGGE